MTEFNDRRQPEQLRLFTPPEGGGMKPALYEPSGTAEIRPGRRLREEPVWSRSWGHHTEQLPMFMATEDVVNKVHKVDSERHPEYGAHGRHTPWSPKDQWERPDEGLSLRDEKFHEARRRGMEEAVKQDVLPPLRIYKTSPRPDFPMTLADGHHRLAMYQHLGHQFVPVLFRNQEVWGGSRDAWKNQPEDYAAIEVKKKHGMWSRG